MSRATQAQMRKLLDLLCEDGMLVDGKVTYDDTNKQTFWKRIARELNAVEGGVYKNHWKWSKVWSDWKSNTLKKANIQLRRKSYSCIPSKTTLSNAEIRLLKVIHYPMDENATNVLKLDMRKEIKTHNHPTVEAPMDFLGEGYPEVNKHKNTSDEEDNINLGEFTRNESKNCNIEDLLGDNNSERESSDTEKKVNIMTENKSEGESSDTEKKVNMRGKKLGKRKMTLEKFKIRASIKLEREKMQQKNEELRLKAIELKLKGEELKVKELEMNKINYLTNIEEEKVKCLKDISTSLKELLERSKNTNGRFQNIL